MGHPQIAWAHIEGKDFTLYFDYDQLQGGKLSQLTDDGKIDWFRRRMQYVFLEPMVRLFTAKSLAYRQLNSTRPGDLPPRSFVIGSFSLLLNGIEALGSFLTSRGATKKASFCTFISGYMGSWDVRVPTSPPADLKELLWKHFRNGIAHGFCIDRGGIDNEADDQRWLIVAGTLEIGPNAFFRDFRTGAEQFFVALNNNPARRSRFLRRFREVYPH